MNYAGIFVLVALLSIPVLIAAGVRFVEWRDSVLTLCGGCGTFSRKPYCEICDKKEAAPDA